MARARNIKPGFFKNEDLAEIGPYAQVLFAGLWTLADREGRLEDRPKRIKAEIFPYYDVDIDKLLTSLHDANFIQRYTMHDLRIIQVSNWKKHQSPHHKEVESVLPPQETKKTKEKTTGNASLDQAQTKHESSMSHDQVNKNASCPTDSLNLIPDSLNSDSLNHVDEIDLKLANYQFELIKAIKPNFKKPNIKNWASVYRLIRERDKRPVDDIYQLLDWVSNSIFWQTVILSPKKLREKLDQLEMQRGRNGTHQHDHRSRAQRHADKLDEIAKRDIEQNGFTDIMG